MELACVLVIVGVRALRARLQARDVSSCDSRWRMIVGRTRRLRRKAAERHDGISSGLAASSTGLVRVDGRSSWWAPSARVSKPARFPPAAGGLLCRSAAASLAALLLAVRFELHRRYASSASQRGWSMGGREILSGISAVFSVATSTKRSNSLRCSCLRPRLTGFHPQPGRGLQRRRRSNRWQGCRRHHCGSLGCIRCLGRRSRRQSRNALCACSLVTAR